MKRFLKALVWVPIYLLAPFIIVFGWVFVSWFMTCTKRGRDLL